MFWIGARPPCPESARGFPGREALRARSTRRSRASSRRRRRDIRRAGVAASRSAGRDWPCAAPARRSRAVSTRLLPPPSTRRGKAAQLRIGQRGSARRPTLAMRRSACARARCRRCCSGCEEVIGRGSWTWRNCIRTNYRCNPGKPAQTRRRGWADGTGCPL